MPTKPQEPVPYQMAGLWKWKTLFKIHAFIALLVISWLIPFTRTAWNAIDHWTFVGLNTLVAKSNFWQTFWAMGNHKYSDWVFDLVILAFFIPFIYKAPKHLKLRRTAQVLFCILLGAFTIAFINRYLFTNLFAIERHSPSLVITPMTNLLSELTPWMNIKTSARFSFPADHATTALLFAALTRLILDRKRARIALLFALFFTLPRLIVGAHWFSDVAIGSLSIVLFVIAWTFFTPLYHIAVSQLEKLLEKVLMRVAPNRFN